MLCCVCASVVVCCVDMCGEWTGMNRLVDGNEWMGKNQAKMRQPAQLAS